MAKWQYLSVMREYRYVEEPDGWLGITTTTVWFHGKAVARFRSEAPATASPDEASEITTVGEQDPEYQPEDFRLLWDHLGSLGWELVTGYVRGNTLRTSNAPGWFGPWSAPLVEFFIFKRSLN